MELDVGNLLLGLVFGAFGVGAWRYGRKKQSTRHMLLGVLLIGFPWATPGWLLTLLVGSVLTGLLFWP